MNTSRKPPLFDGYAPLFEDYRDAKGGEKAAFLLTLAALGAGLEVTFGKRQDLLGATFAFYRSDFETAQLFRVRSPRTGAAAFYDASCPLDKLTEQALRTARSKILGKKALHEAGLLVPFGGAAMAKDLSTLAHFEKAGIRHVVVKPLQGSRSVGVLTNVSLQVAERHIRSKPDSAFMVEQTIPGREFRIFVADEKVVGVVERHPAAVFGDGVSSIGTLIVAENAFRARHPEYATRLIEVDRARHKLDVENDSLDRIPEKGERVGMTITSTMTRGTTFTDETGQVPDIVKKASIEAAKALGLSFTGLDVKLDAKGQPYILEGNTRPGMGLPSFSYGSEGWNLVVPKSIIGLAFPQADWDRTRFRRFDFNGLRADLFAADGEGVVNAADYVEAG